MKAIVFLLGLYLAPLVVQSQVVAVQFDREMTAYLGLDNPITVAIDGYLPSSIILTTNNGRIETQKVKGHYLFIPSQKGYATIYVKNKTPKGIELIDSVHIRVHGLPATLSLAGQSGGKFPARTLYRCIAPAAYVDGFDIDAKFTITHFSIIINRNSKEIFHRSYVGKGGDMARFDDSLTKQIFLTLNNGDLVKIDSVIYEDVDKTECQLPPIELTIVGAEDLKNIKHGEFFIDTLTGGQYYER